MSSEIAVPDSDISLLNDVKILIISVKISTLKRKKEKKKSNIIQQEKMYGFIFIGFYYIILLEEKYDTCDLFEEFKNILVIL